MPTGSAGAVAKVEALVAACEAGAKYMGNCAETVEAAKARLLARGNASLAELKAAVDVAHAELDTHYNRVCREAKKTLNTNVKALEAQIDELLVSAGQLSCAVAIGRRALQSHGTAATPAPSMSLDAVCDSMASISRLIRKYQGTRVSTMADVIPSYTMVNLLRWLDLETRICTGVEPERCTKSGTGSSLCFVDAENTVRIQLRDIKGKAVENVRPEDVFLQFSASGGHAGRTNTSGKAAAAGGAGGEAVVDFAGAHSAVDAAVTTLSAPEFGKLDRVAVSDSGELEITYSVREDAPDEMLLSLSVLGVCNVAEGPWLVRKWSQGGVCKAVGKLLLNIPTRNEPKSKISVNASGSLVAITAPSAKLVEIRSTASHKVSNLVVRNSYNCTVRQAVFAAGSNNLLFLTRRDFVSGQLVDMVERVDVNESREVVSYAAVPGADAVTANSKHVFVAGHRQGAPKKPLIYVIRASDLLQDLTVEAFPERAVIENLSLSPDGEMLAVSLEGARVAIIHALSGRLIRNVGAGFVSRGLKDCVWLDSGDFLIADSAKDRVLHFAADGSRLIRTWAGKINRPRSIAVSGAQAYLVDSSARIAVYQ